MKPTIRGTRFLQSIPLICLLVLVYVIGAGVPHSYAEIFGIALDRTCLAYLKNNITSDCPTYQTIKTLFPDTSETKISGDFGFKDGIYQRLSTRLINHFEYYRVGDHSQLFIDPPGDIRTKINLIEIRANLKEYKLPFQQGFNNANYSLIIGVGRYVDKYCNQASIDASNWIFLVGDTLRYMNSNCDPTKTNYNSIKTTYMKKMQHDITTSYKYKLELWQKQSIERCGMKVCLYDMNQTGAP